MLVRCRILSRTTGSYEVQINCPWRVTSVKTGSGMQRFVWEIMKKSRVWNDFLKDMCSKDIDSVVTQNLDLFGETLYFYPVANTFSQTGCQIPSPLSETTLLFWDFLFVDNILWHLVHFTGFECICYSEIYGIPNNWTTQPPETWSVQCISSSIFNCLNVTYDLFPISH